VRNRQNCDLEPFRHFARWLQRAPHLRILVAVGFPHVRTDWVNYDQSDIADLRNLPLEQGKIGLQIEGAASFSALLKHCTHAMDAT